MLERKGSGLRGEEGIYDAEGGKLVGSVGNVDGSCGRAADGGDGGAAAAEAGVRFAAGDWGGEGLPGVDSIGGRGRWRTPVGGQGIRGAAAAGISHRRRLVWFPA